MSTIPKKTYVRISAILSLHAAMQAVEAGSRDLQPHHQGRGGSADGEASELREGLQVAEQHGHVPLLLFSV